MPASTNKSSLATSNAFPSIKTAYRAAARESFLPTCFPYENKVPGRPTHTTQHAALMQK